MDFSTNTSNINMEAPLKPIQPANLPIKDISEFPSQQAETIQKHLLELDEQGKLLEYFKQQYPNLGAENSLANYILKNWETGGKELFIEWTGIETFSDKYTISAICIKINEVSYGSSTRYFLWKCSNCNYEWVTAVNLRTCQRRHGCPECGKKKIGEATHSNGETLEHWCNTQGEYGAKLKLEFTGLTEDGTPISIWDISRGSIIKVWWHCSNPDCNHEWTANPNNRTYVDENYYRSGCPECAKKKMAEVSHLRGETLDHWCNTQGKYGEKLKSEFLGKLWNNESISIDSISKGSNDKVWWKCSKCSYEWTAKVVSRTYKTREGCPACGGTALIKGVNDLETYCKKLHPELNYILKEFTGLDEDNQPIKANEIARGSDKRIWFKCNTCGKKWLTLLHCRTGSYKSGCPYCNKNSTSFPEQYIYHSLKQLFPDTLSRAKEPINNYEYDITIPSLKLCIEYSGYNWHADKLDRDQDKADHCKANKVNFLQIYAHQGEITDKQGLEADDTYEKNQILYKVETSKSQHIKQLKYIVEFIIDTYAPNHSIKEIDFTLAESEANKVMNKA